MNQKTIAIAAVLMAAALTGLFATSPLAYASDGDEKRNQHRSRFETKEHWKW